MNYRQDKRVWLAGGALVAVLLVAVGWLMVISPKMSSTKSLKSQINDAQFQNVALQSKLAKLRRDNDKVTQLKANLRTALEALPVDSGLPDFTRQLSDQATGNAVALTSITVGNASSAITSSKTPPPASSGPALVSVPVTLISDGPAAHQVAFLKAIQTIGPRRALVTSTQMTAVSGTSTDRDSTMTLQLDVFSAPMTPAAQAQLEQLLNGK